jgi:glycosyltransferase involved in cell wall biosynthesis
VQLVADPADLRPLYRAAAVVLVPVVSGGGVRVKLLDAAARSAPVVSTTLGLEGTTLVPGEDLLVGDTPEAFAAAVAAALADPEAARGRAANAVRKLTSLHSPASVGDEMESIYRAAVHGPAGGG